MNISVKLYGMLRDHLPREAKGRTTLEMPVGSTVADVLEKLAVPGAYMVAVNQGAETDRAVVLQEGDQVRLFPPVGGG